MDEGKPIETCPKDGSEFLAYDPVNKRFAVAEWHERYGSGYVSAALGDRMSYASMDDDFDGDKATLWWSLPVVS